MSIVILHGWSDKSDSFKGLKDVISAGMGAPPVAIHLADWLSLQDDVTMTDQQQHRTPMNQKIPTSHRADR